MCQQQGEAVGEFSGWPLLASRRLNIILRACIVKGLPVKDELAVSRLKTSQHRDPRDWLTTNSPVVYEAQRRSPVVLVLPISLCASRGSSSLHPIKYAFRHT